MLLSEPVDELLFSGVGVLLNEEAEEVDARWSEAWLPSTCGFAGPEMAGVSLAS